MRILVVIALLMVSPAVRSDIVTIGGLNNSPSLPTSGRQAFGGNGSVNTYGIAQSFQFSQDFRITNLKANLFMTSVYPGNFRVNLYSGNSMPNNLISILSYNSFAKIGQTANSYIDVSPIENITVTANQKYWIAIQLDDSYFSSAKNGHLMTQINLITISLTRIGLLQPGQTILIPPGQSNLPLQITKWDC